MFPSHLDCLAVKNNFNIASHGCRGVWCGDENWNILKLNSQSVIYQSSKMESICFDQNQAQYLPAMAAGECVASLAITEPDAGSDMQVALLKYFLSSPRADFGWTHIFKVPHVPDIG